MFELQITEPILPEPISWNYAELKTELTSSLAEYESKVYTEDSIAIAKADAASLRKLKKALNDERIRREKAYMEPFNDFKAQVKEICQMIDSTTEKIDGQLSEFEKARLEKKKADIEELFNKMDFPEWVTLDKIARPEWINKSVTLKKISAELEEILVSVKLDITTIESLTDYSFEAMDYYKRTLNLQDAIAEGQRLEKLRTEKAKAEKVIEPTADDLPIEITDEEPAKLPTYHFKFEVDLTKAQAWALHEFCEKAGIKLTRIK